MGPRSFSSWSSPSPSPSNPSTSVPIEAIPSTPPRPSTLSELSLPDPTLWEPLSTLLVSLPPSLHLTWPLFIPLLTLLLRSSSMIPLQLWQRRQMRQFALVIRPELKHVHEKLALSLRDRSRRKGLSYEQYQHEYKKASQEATQQLYRSYHFHPRLTMYIAPLVNIPLFILVSLILRDACQRALEVLPLSPTDLSSLPSSPTLTPEILSNLQDLATSSILWCPSLCLPDSTMFVPLMVGLATLVNTELSAKMRSAVMRAGKEVQRIEDGRIARHGMEGNGVVGMVGIGSLGAIAGRALTAAEKKRITVLNSRKEGRGLMMQSSHVKGRNELGNERQSQEAEMEQDEEPRTSRIITNAMRCASVAFIPIAALAPVKKVTNLLELIMWNPMIYL
ncbi:BQ2448_6052 [Microbotryum intermedium]|uniref:BQ2448_6052 protein n=1 Tax=Microbotryum intermedium TaxID=269621 RepID=A0A238FIL4_9BASI|nr:BQ2448_6052 [Microbotryum intermedium]